MPILLNSSCVSAALPRGLCRMHIAGLRWCGFSDLALLFNARTHRHRLVVSGQHLRQWNNELHRFTRRRPIFRALPPCALFIDLLCAFVQVAKPRIVPRSLRLFPNGTGGPSLTTPSAYPTSIAFDVANIVVADVSVAYGYLGTATYQCQLVAADCTNTRVVCITQAFSSGALFQIALTVAGQT